MAGTDDERSGRPGTEDDGFLRRWSRRKAEARTAESGRNPGSAPQHEPAAPEETAEPAEIDPKDLPDIESLDANSDFKVFMRAGVPEHLRTLALRKLWRLNPQLANLDGLVDYGGDYTAAAAVVPQLKTAYRVGQGFARRVEELAEKAEAEGEGAGEVPQAAAPASPRSDTDPPGADDDSHARQAEEASTHARALPDGRSGQHKAARTGPRPLPKRG